MKQTGTKNKTKIQKVILKRKTTAYYFGENGEPVRKGGFNKGKILEIDTSDSKTIKGRKVYRVLSVSHENIYILCSKANCERLKQKHINSLAKKLLNKKERENDFKLKLSFPEAVTLIEKKINVTLADSNNPENGLSYYEEEAFDNCDGFGYKKSTKSILRKGGLDEFYEEENLPQKKIRGTYSIKGSGDGIGFNQ